MHLSLIDTRMHLGAPTTSVLPDVVKLHESSDCIAMRKSKDRRMIGSAYCMCIAVRALRGGEKEEPPDSYSFELSARGSTEEIAKAGGVWVADYVE